MTQADYLAVAFAEAALRERAVRSGALDEVGFRVRVFWFRVL